MKFVKTIFTIVVTGALVVVPLSPVGAIVGGEEVEDQSEIEALFEVEEQQLPDSMYEEGEILDNGANTVTENFEEPVTSFYVEQQHLAAGETIATVTFVDGSFREGIPVAPDEHGFDQNVELEYATTSQLFTFEQEIASVTVTSSNENPIQIRTTETAPTVFDTPLVGTNVVGDSWYTLRKSFFTNLGLSIKLREDWGAPGTSPWGAWGPGDISKIVVHHTATDINTSNPAQAVSDIFQYHYYRCSDNNGSYDSNNPREGCDEESEWWTDIGYNYLIDQNGTIYEGRAGGNGVAGAHSPPNGGTIGIGIIGNYTSSNPSNATLQSLKILIAKLGSLNEINLSWGSTVVGHRDRNWTACPGDSFYGALSSVVADARTIQLGSTDTIRQVASEASRLIDGNEEKFIYRSSGVIEMIVDLTKVSDQTENYLRNDALGVSVIKTIDNTLFLSVEEDYAKRLIAETKMYSKGALIQPNYQITHSAWSDSGSRSTPPEYDTSTHWNLEQIKAPEAWDDLGGCSSNDNCGGSSSVTVAVIDTGVAHTDQDFDAGGSYTLKEFSNISIWVPGTDTANSTFDEGFDRQYSVSSNLSDVNFVAPYDFAWDYLCDLRDGTADTCNATELAKKNIAQDDDGHGTFVTSIIAANADDAGGDRLVGIAHNVSIMPLKAFFPNNTAMCYNSLGENDPSCASSNDKYSIRGKSTSFIIATAVNYAVANGADVINMSLGGSGYDSFLQNSINNAVANDITVVAAAGNNASDVAGFFPAGMDNVIAVGAVNNNGSRASYSNYGEEIDVVAPVGSSSPQVRSQWFSCSSADNCYDQTNPFISFTSNTSPVAAIGTSFAAPQVAAAAALLKSKYSDITPLQIENTLKVNATDLGSTGKDNDTGYGRINLESSLANRWAQPSSKNVYRFFNQNTGAHFYTIYQNEKSDVEKLSGFVNEGVAYKVYQTTDIGAVPVYRFFNTDNGVHFYTRYANEADSIKQNLPQFTYEGIAYYVYPTQETGTVPVYRFFNRDTGYHFYTRYSNEKDSIESNLPQFTYEGIAYYVFP